MAQVVARPSKSDVRIEHIPTKYPFAMCRVGADKIDDASAVPIGPRIPSIARLGLVRAELSDQDAHSCAHTARASTKLIYIGKPTHRRASRPLSHTNSAVSQ